MTVVKKKGTESLVNPFPGVVRRDVGRKRATR